jgi:small-conductance mechanosensitive channel
MPRAPESLSYARERPAPDPDPHMQELDDIIAMLRNDFPALAAQFATIWVPIQIGLIVLAALLGWGLAALTRRRLDIISLTMGWPPHLRRAARVVAANLGIIASIVLLLAMRAALQATTAPSRFYLLGVAVSLASAWVAIAVLASLIRNQLLYRIVAVSAWTIAALNILGLMQPVHDALDSAAIVIGGLRLSALLVLKTSAFLIVALWAATIASNFADKRLHSYKDLTPSIQVLLGKLARFTLITFAVLIVLSSVGIDFSSLALFTGALGVGLGFGLQRIVSNLVCGIILLADKSIKPGDVISLGENFGWIDTMGARYTSVVSRDGREYLIPNEDFITQRVINWSYTNDRVRLEVKFGVSYASDPHAVRRFAVEAANTVPRVLKAPEPQCHLERFGDSSLDFLLRFWIHDPVEGLAIVRGAVLLALWDIFKREGIAIPYPVRDVRIGNPVRVVMDRGEQGDPASSAR